MTACSYLAAVGTARLRTGQGRVLRPAPSPL